MTSSGDDSLDGVWVSEGLLAAASDDDKSVTIGYLSLDVMTVYVLSGHRDRVRGILEAAEEEGRWLLSDYGGAFSVVEVENPPAAPAPGGVPRPGDKRVKSDCHCGRTSPERVGPCRRLRDDLFAQSTQYARALCTPSTGDTCRQTWRIYAKVVFYKKEGCKDPVSIHYEYGWLCAGGAQWF